MTDIKLIKSDLHKQIKRDLRQSKTIFILTSFIMESGVKLIFDDLKFALDNQADVKILTGDYLHITQPKALKKLLELKYDNLEIRMWESDGTSFHPKAFIFKHAEDGAVIVGSSNLSRSALKTGVEWNLRMNRSISEAVFIDSVSSFMELFYSNQTRQLNDETIKGYEANYLKYQEGNQLLLPDWTPTDEVDLTLPTYTQTDTSSKHYEEQTALKSELTPRFAQPEALQALENTINEGYSRAMVVMATGLGKTYLAAFFAKRFKRVLFIAHRQEILHQAQASFEEVLGEKGGLLYGFQKDKHESLLFASIYTLSLKEQLHSFDKQAFDLIIVDEFHHAAAKSYQHVINYFEPDFYLGLTATPERTDGQDVFAICDGNIAYEMTFIEAIQNGWLAPFEYYGIKDKIDYSQIKWLGSTYDQNELATQQLKESQAEHILKNWEKHKQTKTLVFCSSVAQAHFLSAYFNEKTYKTLALTGETPNDLRKKAIQLLELGELDALFTVDLFNEGVNIPSVDTLLFARPTESLVVFTQQIGRGLRLHDDKKKCVIIDLIGNYRHADVKLAVFSKNGTKYRTRQNPIPEVPENCEINLDLEVVNLIKEMKSKNSTRKTRLIHDYYLVKENLGKRPSYLDIHRHGLEISKEYKQVFKGYFSFLDEIDELNELEEKVYEKFKDWLIKLENESMSKSYKMVILNYLLSKGADAWLDPIEPKESAAYFHQFYMSKNYRKEIDFSGKSNQALWDYDETKVTRLIEQMPMTHLAKGTDLIKFNHTQFKINLNPDDGENKILYQMTKEIVDYRIATYFERKISK